MLRTSNYDLCQYEGSDKTSYLINYNGDMLKIDTAIKAAKDAADAAQAKANTADGKADSNETAISTLNTQINGVSGIAADVASLQGSVTTINSLIGNGEPTTQDKTIIGAINEIAAEIPSGEVAADHVTYDNTVSGLTADDVQEALDEIIASLPSAGAVELQSGTLTAGQTSVVLTFTEQTIGATTLLDVYVEGGLNYTAIATTSTTVTLTFDVQASNVAVAVRATN